MVGLASTPQSSLRVSSAFWSRYSGPIDEASSGEIVLDDEVLGGSVVEGKGLRW